MSKTSDIIDALIDQLKADDYLSGFVKGWYKGMRERITTFPCIILEIASITDNDTDGYNQIDQQIQLSLIAYLQVVNADNQLNEVTDFTNAIKKAIEADPTLGGTVIDTTIGEELHDFANYPVRSMAVGVAVFNRQTRAVRT